MRRRWLFSRCIDVIAAVSPEKGPCFKFDGNSYLEFEQPDLHLSNSAHYVLNFKTRSPNGIILFAHGDNDYEALYVRDGILNYDLFNPEDSGVGGSYGAHLQSNHRVDNNTVFRVEVFRNRRVRRGLNLPAGEQAPIRTGMILKDTLLGGEEEHMSRPGYMQRVRIHRTLFIGGARREHLSDTVKFFKGRISDIQEKKNDITLVDPFRNMGVSDCGVPI